MINNPTQTLSEIVIESDAITSNATPISPTAGVTAIYINNANAVTVKNASVENNFNGIHIVNSSNIEVTGCHILNAINGGAFVFGSTNVNFNDCVFSNSGYGILMDGENQDCVVRNCSFPSSILNNLLVLETSGLIVENCSFTNINTINHANLVRLGGPAPTQVCTNALIKNCTFVNFSLGNMFPEGLVLLSGSNFIVDSCIIQNNNTGQSLASGLSGIHVSNPAIGASATGAIIRNCVISGSPVNGIFLDSGTESCLIENNLISGALNAGILFNGATCITVTNNTVCSNGTFGLSLAKTSTSNAIIDNVFNSNTESGIFIQGAIPGFSTSSANLIQNNKVFNNFSIGINNQGRPTNQIFGNTAFNNGTGGLENYFPTPFFPTGPLVVGSPGDPLAVGGNIQGML